jgi:hypothetical protein
VRIYEGDGTGAFVSAGEITIPSGKVATGLAAIDVSRDGKSDIIVTASDITTPTAKEARVYLNASGGFFCHQPLRHSRHQSARVIRESASEIGAETSGSWT